MHSLIPNLILLVLLIPAVLTIIQGLCLWFGLNLSEKIITTMVASTFSLVSTICLSLMFYMFYTGQYSLEVPTGTWFFIDHYNFACSLMADALSMPFATFSAILVGLVGAFSARYLHLEPGFARFFFLLSLFGSSLLLVVLAGSLDIIFFGWELIGLTSALLIAFFHERKNTVAHGFRAYITYRICDIGLLTAAVWFHHSVGHGNILTSINGPWAGLPALSNSVDAGIIAFLLLWASMGKSAQFPLGGWLPRAMEGPTPSSAIFYGALSIHLGPYLLLRAWPVFLSSKSATIALLLIGAATALHATLVGRVQSDIKSALAYASMTQVGIIFVEIALGFYVLALIHIIGHAIIRSLQILRSPSLLADRRNIEQALGQILPKTGGHFAKILPLRLQHWLYRFALERGYIDSLIIDYVLKNFMAFFRLIDKADRAFFKWLSEPSADLKLNKKPQEANS